MYFNINIIKSYNVRRYLIWPSWPSPLIKQYMMNLFDVSSTAYFQRNFFLMNKLYIYTKYHIYECKWICLETCEICAWNREYVIINMENKHGMKNNISSQWFT